MKRRILRRPENLQDHTNPAPPTPGGVSFYPIHMRLMGIDYGSKRVGIALSDEDGTMAFPFAVLDSGPSLVSEIKALAESKGVTAIVLGESKDFSGKENPIMEAIRELKSSLERILSIPIHFEPELLTSKEAEHIQGKNSMHDASAATIILNSFINRTRNGS